MAEDCGCGHDAEYAALTVAPDDDSPDLEPDPRGTKVRAFRDQLLAPYGKPTGDKRRFKGGALTSGELPIGVKWQREDNAGHSTSVTVGAIHKIRFGDDGVYGSGVIFDPDPDKTKRWAEDCAEAYGLLQERVIGPSVDLDDMDFHEFVDEADEYSAEARPEIEVDRGRIRAVTLVQIPAFVESRPFALEEVDADAYAAEVDDSTDVLTASGVATYPSDFPVALDAEWDPLDWLATSAGLPGAALYSGEEGTFFPVADISSGTLALIPAAVADAVSVLAFKADEIDLPVGVQDVMRSRLDLLTALCELPAPPWQHPAASLVAAATVSDWIPARDAFEDPKLDKLTPITVVDGRVFGHLASWKSCHIGFKDRCIKAPSSRSNYAHFHVGEIQTSDGPLPVGKITLGGGHADTRLGFQAAAEHYDDAGAAVAAVRAGEDRHGIWVSGVALPGAEDKFSTLPLYPLSGDWRRVGGSMELVAALAVNTPGFGITRVHEAAGRPLALVAAGVVFDPADERVKADLTGKKKKRKRRPESMADAVYGDEDDDRDYASAEEIAFAMVAAQRRERAAAAYGATLAGELAELDAMNMRAAALHAASLF